MHLVKAKYLFPGFGLKEFLQMTIFIAFRKLSPLKSLLQQLYLDELFVLGCYVFCGKKKVTFRKSTKAKSNFKRMNSKS